MAGIFEYAILLQEKRDASGNIVEPAELIAAPKHIVARDQNQATLIAGADVPQELRDDPERMDRLQVAVRPF